MKIKSLMLITFVLLTILTIGAASAVDDVASDDLAVDEEGDVVDVSQDDELGDEIDESLNVENQEIIEANENSSKLSSGENVIYVNHENIITDTSDDDYNDEVWVAGIILPADTTDGHFDIYTDDGADMVQLNVAPAGEGPWHTDENGNLKAHILLKDLTLTNVNDGDNVNLVFFDADGNMVEDLKTTRTIEVTDSYIRLFVPDEDEGTDVIIDVPNGDVAQYDLENEEGLEATFATVSVINGLQGNIRIYTYDEENDEDIVYFDKSLDEITNYEPSEQEGFTDYYIDLIDLDNISSFINLRHFTIDFSTEEDGTIGERSYNIEVDENIIKFWDDESDADDGVIIHVPNGDDREYDLENEEDLNTPFAYVSVRNGLNGRIAFLVWSDEEEEEQQLFGFDLEGIANHEDDAENEGFTVYMLSLNDLNNYDDLLDCGSFKLTFFNDENEEIDSRSYNIDLDGNSLMFWEDDGGDDDEGPHAEGEQIDAEFTSANKLNNDVVVTIPKENVPEDADDEFTVVILQEDDEPIELTFFLDDILEGDNYIIRVNDLPLPEFEENYNLFMFLQFYSEGAPAYYAEYWDDEFGIHIFQSPYIFKETSIFLDDDVITIQEIPEGVDEFTVTISKEGSDDIVKTFKFSDMDIDEEEVWVALQLADLGITEAGEYEITVKYSDDLTYTGNLNVNDVLDIQTDEVDDEGETHTFTSIDEEVAKILVGESITGYVKIYVENAQVGEDIILADLPMGKWPTGRKILLNNFKITESGEYAVKLEVCSESGDLLADKEFDILVEVGGNSVYIDEGSHPYGDEDFFDFTIGAPLSDGQYFNIYFNNVKAGEYTVEDGLEIFEEFTNPIFDVKLIKPGNYDVNVTFFDGESETEIATGSFSINELTLSSDKESYIIDEDDVTISFNVDNLDDDDRLRAYYVFGWNEVQRHDEMIFNPYSGYDMKEDGMYNDGVVSFYAGEMDLGTTLIYVVFETAEGEFSGGFIEVNVVEAPEPVDPGLTIAPIDDVEEDVDVTVSVSANESFSGVVTVLVGDEVVGTIDMVAGQGSLVVGAGNFTVGSNTVKVTSEESEYFLAGEDTATFTVNAKPEPVDPALTISPIADVEEGVDVTVSVSANESFSGVVTVLVNDVEVGIINMAAGQGSLVVGAGNFTVGSNTVKVTSVADDKFTAGEAETIFTVTAKPEPVDPKLTIAPISDVEEGVDVTVSVSANETFSGPVSVLVGETVVGTISMVAGQGSLVVGAGNFTVGSNTVKVTSEESEYFLAGEDTATFTVNAKPEPVDPALTISPIANVEEGVDVTVSVSANESFSGVVTVLVNDVEVGIINMVAGQGSLVVGADIFTVGSNTVKVTSVADDKFTVGEAEITFTVTAKPVPVDPKLTIAPISDVEEGVDVTVSVSANETFSGPVSVLVGETVVGTISMVAGQGSLVVGAGNFTVGSNTVKVTSVADDKFIAGEASATFTVKQKPEPVDPELTITIADITEGQNAVIEIITNVSFSGEVLVKIAGSNYTVAVVNGTGSAPVTDLAVGTYNATAIFKATDLFKASEKNTTFTVKAKVATAITASAVTTTYATSKNIVVTLKDANGNVLAGKAVTVVLNGVTKTLTTNDNGQVSYAIGTKLVPKKYTASIKFDGDSTYLASTGSVKVTVNKAKAKLTAKKKTFKAKTKTKKYTVVLKTDKNKALKNAKVTIKVKSKKFTAKTNSKGKATFKIKKLTKRGKYTAAVTFAGNKYYNKVTKKVKITVKK